MGHDLSQQIVDNVNTMRKNSEAMRMWKNIPLAQECVEMLHALDDPKETSLDEALACRAIVEQLPEYDVPRLVLDILKYASQLLQSSAEEEHSIEEELMHEITRLEDYIDTEHVSDEVFRKRYQRHLKTDPIERTPQWEEHYYEVEQECDRRLGDTPRGMGFCFAYWSTLRTVLAERGIKWRSPAVMNPHVMFD